MARRGSHTDRNGEGTASADAVDFADLLDDLDAVVWESTSDTFVFRFVSLRAVEIFGYPLEEWYEPGFWAERLLHPEDRQGTVATCRSAVLDQRDHELEYRAVAADGSVLWLRDRIRVVLSADGQVELLRGIMLDVTAEKRAREELARERSRLEDLTGDQASTLEKLRVSEERFRALADNAADAIISIDADDVIRFANPATAALFGYDLDELLGAPLTRLMPRRFHERHLAGLQRVSRTGERRVPWSGLELIGRHSSGREIPLWISFGEVVQGGQHLFTGIIRDLSSRYDAEQALRQSEERFREFAAHVPQVLWIASADDQLLYVNDAYSRIFGRPVESLHQARHSWVEIVHPEDRTRVQSWLDSGRPQPEIEYRIVKPDGSVRWILDRSFRVQDDAGEVTRLIGTAEDITERKESRARVEQAEAHYRRLVQTSPYAIYVLDAEGRFIEVNAAAEPILGRTSAEMLGRHFLSIIPEEAQAEGVAAFEEIFVRGKDGFEMELPIARPSGERRLLSVVASAIRSEGVATGVHGIARDITSERVLDEQRRMLEGALARVPDAISITTEDGEYAYANPAHAQLFGYDPGHPPADHRIFMPDADAEAQSARIWDALRSEGRWQGRVRRRRPDGTVVTMSLLTARVPGDRPTYFSVLRDASADIEREQHLRRVERLASLGTLIGGVAHELNNPLTAIVGFTHLMMADERSGEDVETLETIAREAERAAKIVSDLRLVARTTQDEQPPTVAVDLNDVVRHVLKVRAYSLSTRNVEVLERLADILPPVRGNRPELEQVVLNLIVNAEQALAHVSDRPRSLVLRTRVSASGATLHVIDNGPGIARDDLDRIFDPFFTTKSPGEGTGLGLSLVHSIVADHGGELRVESEPGRGAEFVVELQAFDVAGEARAARPAGRPAERAPTPLRVLVVDDETAIRGMLGRSLRRRGHTVIEAAEGEEALRLIADRAADFDVVVSDLRMPGLGGEQLLTRLRELRPELAKRVIFITGDPASTAGGRIDGDVPVLMKPFRLDEVARLVEGRAGPGGSPARA